MYTVPDAVCVDITVDVEHHSEAKEHDCFDEKCHLRKIKATGQLVVGASFLFQLQSQALFLQNLCIKIMENVRADCCNELF